MLIIMLLCIFLFEGGFRNPIKQLSLGSAFPVHLKLFPILSFRRRTSMWFRLNSDGSHNMQLKGSVSRNPDQLGDKGWSGLDDM